MTFMYTCFVTGEVGWGAAMTVCTGTRMSRNSIIDREWSFENDWVPVHVNATEKKDGHTMLFPVVCEMVFQNVSEVYQ